MPEKMYVLVIEEKVTHKDGSQYRRSPRVTKYMDINKHSADEIMSETIATNENAFRNDPKYSVELSMQLTELVGESRETTVELIG